MLNADDALHYEIIRSAHDPDPNRAFRYRPFHYGPSRHLMMTESPAAPAPYRRPRMPVWFTRRFSLAKHFGLWRQRQPAACCCCAPCC